MMAGQKGKTMKKKFYVLRHSHKYNGERYYYPSVEKRFATREEAEQFAAKWNELEGKEANEKLFRSWVEDKEIEFEFATEEWYEQKKDNHFYKTYEVKESK
jgi:hypothetical protein